ncbi:MAG: HAD-IA family hydrolase [Acidimicrobiia bacterium]|nr:HAD-IA family hydrolase [Acidimicrobiia bacterium]
MMRTSSVILDLDGVIRHFDPDHRPGVERRHGLPDGVLAATAWQPHLTQPAITGAMTRAEWIGAIGREVGSVAAVEEWLGHRGHVDTAMVGLVAELRRNDVVVSVLTNGTDTVPDELTHHGLGDAFDHVFNSWSLRRAKLDPAVFVHVCDIVGVDPSATFFTDDRQDNVDGARQAGLRAERFVGIERLRRQLEQLGL